MKYVTSGAAAVLVISLAGCGGTGGGTGGGSQSTLGGYLDEFEDISLAFVEEGMTPIDGANMPTAGTASYSGPLVMMAIDIGDVSAEYGVLGAISLDADFNAGSVSGEATDFVEFDVSGFSSTTQATTATSLSAIGAVGGTLDISGGAIDSVGFGSFDQAMMTGTLTGIESGDAYVDAELFGAFYSANGTSIDLVLGGGGGTSTSGSGVTDVIAVFVAD